VRLRFAEGACVISPEEVGGDIPSSNVKPSCEHRVAGKGGRIACEEHEHLLRDVFRAMRSPPQRRSAAK
jgi:hypothetical protein